MSKCNGKFFGPDKCNFWNKKWTEWGEFISHLGVVGDFIDQAKPASTIGGRLWCGKSLMAEKYFVNGSILPVVMQNPTKSTD